MAETTIAAEEVASEVERLRRALAATDEQLQRLQQRLAERNQGTGHDIVGAHRLMLESPELADASLRLVARERIAAESAVRRTLDQLRDAFAALDDPYFRERGGDVEAIGERLLRTLLGLPELRPGEGVPGGAIAVGAEISALDVFALKRAGILGVATESGGKTSHAAILARALGLPYVAGVRGLTGRIRCDDSLIVDGTHGEVILNPDPETRRTFEAMASAEAERSRYLTSSRPLRAVTRDGVDVHLSANVECFPEIAAALELGAESIGLFRTEFLYLERADLPSEDEQVVDAVAVVRALGGRPVTFRTLDLGGDKLPASLHPPRGPNPALGMRSIRFSLANPHIFRTQLRALYRASATGPIRILFPLVSGVVELRRALDLCRAVRDELRAEGQAYDPDVPVGAMIETPSAAWTIDHLAADSDFFSVGTNDLMQYTFAADRENQDVAHLYHPLHPAMLRSLKHIVDAARAASRPLSICGDMAGDPAFTWVLLGLGFRDLSMTARQIPVVKAVVRASSLREAEDLTARALELDSEVEVERLVLGVMSDRFGEEIEGVPIAADAVEPPASDAAAT